MHRAVLNVVESSSDCFNGLLVSLQNGSDFEALDQRERGYDRALVPLSHIAYAANAHRLAYSAPASRQAYIYLGKSEKRNDSILPNKAYLDLCLRGAKHWGAEFYEQFLQTTYIGTLTLKAFLQGNG